MNRIRRMCLVMCVLPGGLLLAQYMVNPRVDNSLYGAGNINGSVKYPNSSVPMESETRHAHLKSGASPAEIKARANAVGPMPSGGKMDYVVGRPQPLPKPLPTAQGSSAFSTGSVNRATIPSNSNQRMIQPKQFNNAMPSQRIR